MTTAGLSTSTSADRLEKLAMTPGEAYELYAEQKKPTPRKRYVLERSMTSNENDCRWPLQWVVDLVARV